MMPNQQFESSWWTVAFPLDWKGKQEPECVSFVGDKFPSALNISAAMKSSGCVTIPDLKDFAVKRRGPQPRFEEVQLPEFNGIYGEHTKDKTFWREWWIAAKNVAIYVTYNVDEKFKNSETNLIDTIVRSIKLSPALETN